MENGRPDELVRLVVWQKLFREDANWEELAWVRGCVGASFSGRCPVSYGGCRAAPADKTPKLHLGANHPSPNQR